MKNFIKKLFSPKEMIIFSFFIGFFIGIMTALSARYPINVKSFKEAEELCGKPGLRDIKTLLTGEIYFIMCNDGKTFSPPR